MKIKDTKLNGDHIPMGSTHDSNGCELSYKDGTGCWYERTCDTNGCELSFRNSAGNWHEYAYDSNGSELSYKTNDFEGIRIADDGNYVLHYDSTSDTFLAGCSDTLTRTEAIRRWNRDDDRALLYTLAIISIGL